VQPARFTFARRAASARFTPTGRIQLDAASGPHQHGYLPNIDITMKPSAAYAGAMSIRRGPHCMGSDGANGAKSH